MTLIETEAGRAPGRRAIIDIGSNTVRLVIYDGSLRAPDVLYNEKVTARLGKGVTENGKLSAKAKAAALAALTRYALLLRLQGVADVECVATAAVRDASNGAEFLARVAALGLEPRLLSGEEEAVASAHGVQAAFPGAQGVVGDLGGGSLELIDIGAFGCRHGVSLPLGTLRIQAMRALKTGRFGRRVNKLLRDSDWAVATGQPFYLVGGSWRALARYAMLRDAWPVDDPHGYEMSAEAALKLARVLAVPGKRATGKGGAGKSGVAKEPASPAGLARMGPGISASRASSLPDAAALLAVLVRELRPSRLVFSGWGLREGLLTNRLDDPARATDPLLAGVRAFVGRIGEDLPERAELVARWCARVDPGAFGIAAAGSASITAQRLCATMLALASMRTEPNLRAEQASEWALRKRWIGIDAEGRAMLAVAVRANSARTAIPPELLRMASPSRLREALAWGLAVRLCRRLSAGAPAALAETALLVDGGRLVLAARGTMIDLCTETVAKDHRLLAESLGLAPAFVVVAAAAPLP